MRQMGKKLRHRTNQLIANHFRQAIDTQHFMLEKEGFTQTKGDIKVH